MELNGRWIHGYTSSGRILQSWDSTDSSKMLFQNYKWKQPTTPSLSPFILPSSALSTHGWVQIDTKMVNMSWKQQFMEAAVREGWLWDGRRAQISTMGTLAFLSFALYHYYSCEPVIIMQSLIRGVLFPIPLWHHSVPIQHEIPQIFCENLDTSLLSRHLPSLSNCIFYLLLLWQCSHFAWFNDWVLIY